MSKFHRDRVGRAIGWLGVVVFGVVCLYPVWGYGGETASDSVARMVYRGEFDQAQKILATQPSGATNQPTNSLLEQLRKYSVLTVQREKSREETYAENAKEAQNYLSKAEKSASSQPATQAATTKPAAKKVSDPLNPGKRKVVVTAEKSPRTNIEKALTAARKAKYYAADQKQFGQLAWVRRIAELSKVEAEKYLKSHEWLKAGNIYAELATIYEDEKSYDKLTREYAMRVRLEAIYKAKSDWQDQIKNIKIDVLPELSHHISNYYVETPDFGKMIATGLRSVAMVTEIPKLAEVFPSLKDPQKTKQFDSEMKKLMDQVAAEKTKKAATSREFWQAFVKMVVINDGTIDLPQEMIIKEFVDAALGELDPFTNVIWPYELEDFEKHTTGQFNGVGIQISMENRKLKVITPIPGSPAFKAGILPGDSIVTINGESTENITIDQAVRRITGPKDTQVTLGISHPWDDHPRDIKLIRDTIVIQTVKGYRMDKNNRWEYFADPKEKIAYVRVTQFTDNTVPELTEALKEITRAEARGLILDLRFNPGGTLSSAVEMVNLFVSKGVIVSTKGRAVEAWNKSATASRKMTDLPMIVLINDFSASAAEIVSGALRDYHRAGLIGERSFGKGSVQNVLGLVNDTLRLKMTTAYYYLPLGTCIHKKADSKSWGVEPDLKIKLTPNEIRDIMDLQRDAEIVSQVNGMKVPSTTSKPQPTAGSSSGDEDEDDVEKAPASRKYPAEDVQLQAAVAVMQARLAFGVPWETMTIKAEPTDKLLVESKKR